jgi:hypothetical protein
MVWRRFYPGGKLLAAAQSHGLVCDFDSCEVAEEFGLIKEIGLMLMRIFLLCDDWQPEIGRIDRAALDNLERVCDTADRLAPALDVTFFTGHMSSPNWAPIWMLQTDRPMPAGVNQVVSGGKVVDCEIDDKHPITYGLHVPSLTSDNGLGVNEVFREVDLPVIHGYPMYADWANGPLDADFVPFLCALVSAWCGKPTLADEFGGPTKRRANLLQPGDGRLTGGDPSSSWPAKTNYPYLSSKACTSW